MAISIVPSFHIFSSNLWYQKALLAAHLALATLLLFGWKTRWVTPALWVFTVSLHYSNEWILNGGDYLTRNLLFFSIFLPWGEQLRLGGEKLSPRVVAHAGSVALFAQLCLLYWSTAMLKAGPDWVTEGTALFYALHLDSFATSLAETALVYPELLTLLTRLVYGLEWIAPLLILSGFPILRIVGISLLVILHLGIALCLEVGLFWLVPIALVVAFLPPTVWGKVSSTENQEKLHPLAVGLLSLVLMLLTYLNVARMPSLNLPIPVSLYKTLRTTGLHYGWEMFTGLSRQHDGWYLVEAKVDGKTQDILWGLLDRKKPGRVSGLYPNQRWRRYMLNLKEERYIQLREVLVKFAQARFPKPSEQARLIFMKETTSLNYRDAEPEAVVLWPNLRE